MVAQQRVSYTDEATELANFFYRIATYKSESDDERNYTILCEFGGFDSNNVETLEAIAEIGRRASRLNDFIATLDDEVIDQYLKDSLRLSVKTLVAFAAPLNFSSSWNAYVNLDKFMPQINNLRLFGRIVRDYKPINKVTDADISTLRSTLSDAYAEALETTDISEWAKFAILQGLDRVNFRISHFDFFGHDATISALAKLRFDVEVVARSQSEAQSRAGKLVALGIFVMTATQVLIRPAEVAQAINTYRSALSELMSDSVPLISPPLRQITGPNVGPEIGQTNT